jgi:hypothetical protein
MTEREEALEEAATLCDAINYGLACEIRALKSSSPPPKGGEGCDTEIIETMRDAISERLGEVISPDGIRAIATLAYTALRASGMTVVPQAQVASGYGKASMQEGSAEQPKAASEHLSTVHCSDCPPTNYPTDKTRCSECPRRAALSERTE